MTPQFMGGRNVPRGGGPNGQPPQPAMLLKAGEQIRGDASKFEGKAEVPA
jgi:hypothetical protein